MWNSTFGRQTIHPSWVDRRACKGISDSQGRRAEVLLFHSAPQDQPVVGDQGLRAVATVVYCRMDIDENDLPLPSIVLLGSPVGSDDFVKEHLISKSTKVDVVLGMIADMDNAQIAMPLHRSCLSVVISLRFFEPRRRS
jgi:hypothetical protein